VFPAHPRAGVSVPPLPQPTTEQLHCDVGEGSSAAVAKALPRILQFIPCSSVVG